MICAFDDALIDDCMHVYELRLNKKRLNKYPHIFVNIEIMEILPKVHKNLLTFKREIITLYRILKKLSQKKNERIKITANFYIRFKKQFKKLIRTDGVYFIN